jgi:hypothetical protein
MGREKLLLIEAEIRRILISHQAAQIERVKSDMAKFGGKHTMASGEVLASIDRLDVMPIQDVVLARCYLRVESGGLISLNRPV